MNPSLLRWQLVASEIRFPGSIKFAQNKLNFINDIHLKRFPDWQESHTDLVLTNKEDKLTFEASCKNAVCRWEKPNEFAKYADITARIFSDFSRSIDVVSVQRAGIVYDYLYEVKISFAQLLNQFQEKFSVFIPKTFNYKDSAFINVFEKKNINFRVQIGPLSKKEGEVKLKENKELPDVAVAVNIDCYRKDTTRDAVRSLIDESFPIAQDLVREHIDRLGL